jgi:L-aspartate oxidase
MQADKFDYLVVGSGLAGLSYALRAAENGSVCLLTKAEIYESNTSYAQGGIAAAVGESDDWRLHEEDTLKAGGGINDRDAVRHLVQSAPDAIRWLVSLGASFDRVKSELQLGREGGHSRNRIVHHADRTGWEIERAVSEAARYHQNITIYENAFVTDLVLHEGRCVGALAHLGEQGFRTFQARATMLATGGCGRAYQHTTNPRVATGDGIGLAYRAGAEIRDMEFMQFHPTTLHHEQLKSFLVSEAVRGAGGILRNHKGRRFMYDYDDRLELAPRDVVARAIVSEIRKLDTWCVYLDVTHLKPDDLEQEFPTIWNKLRSIGLEIEKEWIPVVPAQHYSCGGVKTDLKGQTSVPGLYAAGEVASTGVHGANRLASNSLLEAIVYAQSAARDSASLPANAPDNLEAPEARCIAENDAIRIRNSVKTLMNKHANVLRSNEGLERAAKELEQLKADYRDAPSAAYARYSLETLNLLQTALMVVEGARKRKESVGLHYNVDLDPNHGYASTSA